jgi:excisionase family DNA binding protein
MARTQMPTLPSDADVILARRTSRILASGTGRKAPSRLRVLDEDGVAVELPASAVVMLQRILEEMARGNTVTVLPVQAELTTQESADLLNISRPSLIQLLDDGRIEYRRVGTHRRIRFASLLKFKRRADADRRAALAELAAYDQELGI